MGQFATFGSFVTASAAGSCFANADLVAAAEELWAVAATYHRWILVTWRLSQLAAGMKASFANRSFFCAGGSRKLHRRPRRGDSLAQCANANSLEACSYRIQHLQALSQGGRPVFVWTSFFNGPSKLALHKPAINGDSVALLVANAVPVCAVDQQARAVTVIDHSSLY